MDASHLADLHVQRMSLWLLNVDSEMAIFRGALYCLHQVCSFVSVVFLGLQIVLASRYSLASDQKAPISAITCFICRS